MRIQLKCVIVDGSAPAGIIAKPALPYEQRIELPKGEELEVQLVCIGQNGAAYDVAAQTLMLTVRRRFDDAEPMFAREAVLGSPTTAGIATVTIAAADTMGLQQRTSYLYDVQLTNADGDRFQVVPASAFFIKPIVGLPGEVPGEPLYDAGAPIAIGPRGYGWIHGEGPPDDTEGRDGDYYIDDLTAELYGPKTEGEWDVPFADLGTAGVAFDGTPASVGTATAGVSTAYARGDHVHAHGNQAGGSLHAAAIAGGAAGFMTGAMAQQLADFVGADFGGLIAALDADIGDLATDLSTLSTTVGGHTTTLGALSTTVGGHTTSIATLTTDLGTLTTTVAGISANYVANTRSVGAGAGLTGGGTLAADIALDVAALDATIDVQANGIRVGVIGNANLDDVVTAGSATFASITVNAKGRITAFANGTDPSTLYVPLVRTLTTTAPLLIDGAALADLSANRTLSISAATTSTPGTMSAADKTILDAVPSTYVSVTRTVSTTGPLAGGGALSGNLTLTIGAASGAAAGTMSSTDFTKVAGIAALTTKGDLLGYSTVPVRVPVGATTGHVLTVNPAAATGWEWAAASSGAVAITDNVIPRGNGTTIVDSTLTLVSNTFTHAASSSGAGVGFLVSNSSNTASATATIEVRVGGATASDPRIDLAITGGRTWRLRNNNQTSPGDVFEIYDATNSAGRLFAGDEGIAINQGILAGFQLLVRPTTTSGTTTALFYSGTASTSSARAMVGQNAGAFGEFSAWGNGDSGNIAGIAKANLISLVASNSTALPTAVVIGAVASIPTYVIAGGAARQAVKGNGNIAFNPTITTGADATPFGGGVKVVSLGLATTEPTAAPTDGNVLLWAFGSQFKCWVPGGGAPVVLA